MGRFDEGQCIEVSTGGLAQADILDRQTARALRGEELDAVIFNLPLGVAPIPEMGGTGFRIGTDPPDGPGAFARKELQRIRDEIKGRRGRP
jgi:hypothetical protein